jgi:ribosomal protein L6P/L9E
LAEDGSYGSFVELKTEGVGLKFLRYYAAPQLLCLTLGFSHTILFRIPKKVKFRCLKYKLLLFSFDLKELRNTAYALELIDHQILTRVKVLNL